MNESDDDLPSEILETVKSLDFLPEKSKDRYNKEYEVFKNWCNGKGVKSLKEEVLLAYFAELSKTIKPNTLWSKYSMLKSKLKIEKDVDISRYFKLTAFLKKMNIGFQPKKAKVFTNEQISKFLLEAPDEIYLMIKVATIFGLAGACRREELCNLTTNDVIDKGDFVMINISQSKNHTSRCFTISKEVKNGKYLALYRKYASLRKPNTKHNRFFTQYKKGVISVQCVGINTFGKMPADIAGYLGLPDPHLYTGHSFRRSSATMLADSGEGITNIKRLGGWKSTSVAEGYIEESAKERTRISNKILNQKNPTTFTTSASASQSEIYSIQTEIQRNPGNAEVEGGNTGSTTTIPKVLSSAINLQNANNCSFIININSDKI